MQEKKTICVFQASQARQLLKKGFTIVNLKKNRNDASGKLTVFVFRNDPGFLDALNDISS